MGPCSQVPAGQVCLLLNHWLFSAMVLGGCPAPDFTEEGSAGREAL